MNANAQYLATKVMTASPEQLQLMLYDGALRFARQGRDALAQNRLDASHDRFSRAQRILLEMNAALRPSVDPELCRRLGGLYMYIYRQLVQSNLTRDLAHADDAISLLEYQRETWVLLLDKLAAAQHRPAVDPATLTAAPIPAAQPAGLNVAV